MLNKLTKFLLSAILIPVLLAGCACNPDVQPQDRSMEEYGGK